MIICPECGYDSPSGGTHDFQGWSCPDCGHCWPLKGQLEIITELEGEEV